MSDLERLEATLDDVAFTLQAIADCHEEEGNAKLAAAYRWLAENKRVPAVAGKGAGYKWAAGAKKPGNQTGLPDAVFEPAKLQDTVEQPNPAWFVNSGGAATRIDKVAHTYPTMSAAYRAAAEAYKG